MIYFYRFCWPHRFMSFAFVIISISSTLIKFLGKKSVLRSDDLVHSTMKAVFSLFQSLASFLSPHLIDFLSKVASITLA